MDKAVEKLFAPVDKQIFSQKPKTGYITDSASKVIGPLTVAFHVHKSVNSQLII